MDKLLQLIQKKLDELSSTEIDYDTRDYLELFLSQYDAKDPTSYSNVTNASYLFSLILSSYDEFNIGDIEKLVNPIQYFINYVATADEDDATYEAYVRILKELNEKGIIVKVNNHIEENKKYDIKDLVLYKTYKKLRRQVFNYIEKDEEKQYFHDDIANCFDILFLTVPDVDIFTSIVSADYLAKNCQKMIDDIRNDLIMDCFAKGESKGINIDREISRMIDKKADKLSSKIKVDSAQISEQESGLISKYNCIKEKYSREESKVRSTVKDINKKLNKLENLFNYIVQSRKGEISIDKQVLDMLFDPEVKLEFLKYAIKKNLTNQLEIEDINKELNKNSISKFELIFSEFDLNFNNFNNLTKQKIAEVQSDENIRKILQFLTTPELEFMTQYLDQFAKIFYNSNPDIVKFIYNLLKRNIIDRNFLIKNIDIIYNSKSFETLYKNINYLDSIGVNLFNLGKSNPDILLIDNDNIVTQTNILDEYGFKLDGKELYNFNVLDDTHLLDIIDNFIELGYGDMILNNPKYLYQKSDDIIKRILICNLIGMNPVNSSNRFVGAVSTGNGFYIEQSRYDNYIVDYKEDYLNDDCVNILRNSKRNVISNSTKSRTIIKIMDELYMSDRLTYVIAGTKISRKRVKRNLEVLLNSNVIDNFDIKELTYQAILYNMICNVEPCVLDQIYNSIMNIQIETDKVYTFNY